MRRQGKHDLRDSAGRGPVPGGSAVKTVPEFLQLQHFTVPSSHIWECGVYKYILSVCCENIIIYTGLQLSFCIILGVQTENLSSLPKKPNQQQTPKTKTQTTKPNKPKQQTNASPALGPEEHHMEPWGGGPCSSAIWNGCAQSMTCSQGTVKSPWTSCDLQCRYMIWIKNACFVFKDHFYFRWVLKVLMQEQCSWSLL